MLGFYAPGLNSLLEWTDAPSDMINTIDRFQMVSLLKLAKVTEEGVRFLSPHDGTPM